MLLFDPIETWKKTKLPGGSYTMREILVPVFKNGACIYKSPSVMEIAEYCRMKRRHCGMRPSVSSIRIKYTWIYPPKLYEVKKSLLDQIEHDRLEGDYFL